MILRIAVNYHLTNSNKINYNFSTYLFQLMLIYCICFRVALSLPILFCTMHTSYRYMSRILICRLAVCMICNSLAVAKSPLIFRL